MKTKENAEKFLARIEKYIKPQSSPGLIKKIMSELKLDELKTDNKEFKDFVLKATTEEMDLQKLINHLKTSIVDNEPLRNLLAYIEENNLITEPELKNAADSLQLQLNILCLFEAITITMANGKGFAQDVYDLITKRHHLLLPGNPVADFFFGAPYKASLFERLKLVSIKPGFISILFHKTTGEAPETQAAADTYVTNHGLSGTNAAITPIKLDTPDTSTVSAMGLNILEAAWEDSTGHSKDHGGLENAQAGIGLIAIMEILGYLTSLKLESQVLPEGTNTTDSAKYDLLSELQIDRDKKKVSQFYIHPEWRDLYSSWNLLFVLANIDSIFMPIKLLLPTVFSAKPENYKEVRVISLFLLGSLFLREDPKSNPFFINNYTFDKQAEIFKKWGEINKQYAGKLLSELTSIPSKELDNIYAQIFGNYPNINFMRHLLAFNQNPAAHRFAATNAPASQAASPAFFSNNTNKSPIEELGSTLKAEKAEKDEDNDYVKYSAY